MAGTRRRMSYRGVRNRLESDAQRITRRQDGRWAYVNETTAFSVGSGRGKQVLSFTRASSQAKCTFYGWDGLLMVTITGTTAKLLGGAIVCFHMRPGQSVSDWFKDTNLTLPEGVDDGNELARYGKFIPLVLAGDQEATRASVVIPWRAFLPRELLLKPDESHETVVSFSGTLSGSVTAQAVGRYRYIVGAQN